MILKRVRVCSDNTNTLPRLFRQNNSTADR